MSQTAQPPSEAILSAGELWRKISGWDYDVPNLGRVRNRMSGQILAPRRHANGYCRVNLCNAGLQQDAYIHRLVCEAFHGSAPLGCTETDHINHCRFDNRAVNLRWISIADNHARRLTARGERCGSAKLTEDQVKEILRRAILPKFDRVLAAEFGVSRESIRDIRNRKYWRHLNVNI